MPQYWPLNLSLPLLSQCILALSLLLSSVALCQQSVLYPRPESDTDVRSSYPLALLQYCERQNQQLFTLAPSPVHTQQGRSLRQLIAGNGMDVVWALTNQVREDALLPIRIPIDRGLIGWRLLLINERNSALFNGITSPAALAQLSAGQGHDWPDVDILRANGFTVFTSSTYAGLFHMLARDHIQYFPRSVSEIWPELEANTHLKLAVQPSLVIYYPSAQYFFVNRKNQWLAQALESCLVNATQNGDLKALFDSYYLDFIRKSNLNNRIILTLNNPLLPDSTPASDSGYWLSPEEYQ